MATSMGTGSPGVNVELDGILNVFHCLFVGLALGIAPLKKRHGGHVNAVLILLYYDSELVVRHCLLPQETVSG
jgi:hypothetical protein